MDRKETNRKRSIKSNPPIVVNAEESETETGSRRRLLIAMWLLPIVTAIAAAVFIYRDATDSPQDQNDRANQEVAKADAETGEISKAPGAASPAGGVGRVPSQAVDVLRRAVQLASRQAKNDPDSTISIAYMQTEIAIVQVQAGDIEGAKQTALVIKALDEDLYEPTLRKIAVALAQAGHVDKATRAARQLEGKFNKLRALVRIAEIGGEARRLKSARSLYSEVRRLSAREDVVLLDEVARSQARVGLINDALETVSEIDDNTGITKRPYDQILIWSAVRQAEAGDIEGAARALLAIGSYGGRDRVRSAIAMAYARGGEFDKASGYAMAIELATYGPIRLAEIAFLQTMASKGGPASLARFEEAVEEVIVKQSLRRGLRGFYASKMVEIARLQAESGNTAGARHTLDRAFQILTLDQNGEFAVSREIVAFTDIVVMWHELGEIGDRAVARTMLKKARAAVKGLEFGDHEALARIMHEGRLRVSLDVLTDLSVRQLQKAPFPPSGRVCF